MNEKLRDLKVRVEDSLDFLDNGDCCEDYEPPISTQIRRCADALNVLRGMIAAEAIEGEIDVKREHYVPAKLTLEEAIEKRDPRRDPAVGDVLRKLLKSVGKWRTRKVTEVYPPGRDLVKFEWWDLNSRVIPANSSLGAWRSWAREARVVHHAALDEETTP